MNHPLDKLAADFQAMRRKNRETPPSEMPDIASISIPPYEPSEAVKRFDEELAAYNKQIQCVYFDEIR